MLLKYIFNLVRPYLWRNEDTYQLKPLANPCGRKWEFDPTNGGRYEDGLNVGLLFKYLVVYNYNVVFVLSWFSSSHGFLSGLCSS